MKNNKKSIFIIAGEESGDTHASDLVKSIISINNQLEFRGIGGKSLASAGVELIYNFKEINFIGFLSVIKNIYRLKKFFNSTIKYIKLFNPDVIILVDFPGFNLRIAKKLKKFYKGRIVYYISPQLWAWHKSRINIIRKTVDKMLVIFPFEVNFYKNENVEAIYTGHPLKDRISNFLEKHSKTKSGKYRITLLPGSRREEIKKIFPTLIEAAAEFKKLYDAEINVICAQNIEPDLIKSLTGYSDYRIIKKKDDADETGYLTIYNSDFVLCKSGTSTLECCLLETPFCVVYKMSYLNYLISRLIIKVNYISIVNILAGREIVREFIQKEFNVLNLVKEGKRLLLDEGYRTKMTDNFSKIRNDLFGSGNSGSAGKIISDIIK